MWMPRHLWSKSEGRFGAKDYQDHCERGGHPTPEARFLLREHGLESQLKQCGSS